MKLTPRSIAVRTMRRLSCSSTVERPRCQPPSPIGETRSRVFPRTRYSEMAFCALLGMLFLSWLRRFGPLTRDSVRHRCVLQSGAPPRHSCQGGEIAVGVAACGGLEQALVHDIGQRHWR